jgi:hypothetical protein
VHLLERKNFILVEMHGKTTIKKKAYYVKSKIIKSKLLRKNVKIKIYKTMIRPVVTYSSETWTLTAKDKKNLRILKGKY